MRRRIGLMFALLLLLPVLTAAQSQLPNTPVRPVTEDYFGTKVVDPYRWLENTSDPEVIAWMKAQNDYTRAVLARIPGRDELLARIKSLDNAGNVSLRPASLGRPLFLLQNRARLRQSQALHARHAKLARTLAGGHRKNDHRGRQALLH